MEMSDRNRVLKFLNWYRVTCEYPGPRNVCRCWKQPEHFNTSSSSEVCTCCSTFRHSTATCMDTCCRCSGNHATADFSSRYGYVSIVAVNEIFSDRPATREPVVVNGACLSASTTAPESFPVVVSVAKIADPQCNVTTAHYRNLDCWRPRL